MEACAQPRDTAYESPEAPVVRFQLNSLWIGNIRAPLRYQQVSRQSCIYFLDTLPETNARWRSRGKSKSGCGEDVGFTNSNLGSATMAVSIS
jgi:hypothetical protein